jgi:glycerol-1-phosphate dehydrogenase [NAD(P)+]
MNITEIVERLKNCPCGRAHTVALKAAEVGPGLLGRAARILRENGFPRKLLLVADRNTLRAAAGLRETLEDGGFQCFMKLFGDLRVADMADVRTLTRLCYDVDGVLSVGSGSLNDICRLAAHRADKRFAIFATAPSMDGFASDSAPVTHNNFKRSYPARCPEIIIGDTDILAAAPSELNAAGFGDMLAKYVALADWRIANLATGEYYCERVAALVRTALGEVVARASLVARQDAESARAVMEALVLSGLCMALAGSSRPASGAEHVVSHFWEIKKLEAGALSDFHGKKVGVATLGIAKMYHWLAERPDVRFQEETLDWRAIYEAYGPNFAEEVKEMNSPTVTVETSPRLLNERWEEMRRIIKEEIPPRGELLALMNAAGAAVSLKEIGVSEDLGALGLQYHPYMRHRMLLTRLVPMTSVRGELYAELRNMLT